jgi:hypothetical protein
MFNGKKIVLLVQKLILLLDITMDLKSWTYRYLLSMVLVCSYFLALSQRNIGADVFYGKVLEHKEGLLFEIPPVSYGATAWVQHELSGKEAWHHYWGLPKIEGLLMYMNYGDADVLGQAVAIAPGFAFNLKRWKNSSLLLHYSTGISYLNKPFDPITNLRNNAIGSHVNNLSRLKISWQKSINEDWGINIGLSFNHFSNGLTSSPNSGINTYGLNVGLQWSDGKKREIADKPNFVRPRKWGISAMTGIGLSEHSNFGGPNFPVYFTGAGIYYRFADFQRLHIGAEYEFSSKVFEFELSIFNTEELARAKARRTIIYIAEELMFGPVSMRLQLGFYTPYKSDYSGDPFYIKIMTLYHPPIKPLGEVKPFVGIMLKTHFAVAEYIGMTAGVTF